MKRLGLILLCLISMMSCAKTNHKNNNSFFDKKAAILDGYIIEKVTRADFDGNLQDDFIYLVFSEKTQTIEELWITDEGSLFLHLKDLPSQNHYFFLNLDDDNALEAIIFRGEEDGTDAFIADIKNNKINKLFFFNPVVEKDNKYYWGYAWDIDSLIINENKEIFSSFDTKVDRDDDFSLTKTQINLPTLVFHLKTNAKPEFEIEVGNVNYHSLNDIYLNSRK